MITFTCDQCGAKFTPLYIEDTSYWNTIREIDWTTRETPDGVELFCSDQCKFEKEQEEQQ